MFRSLLLLVAFVACRAYVAPLPLRAVSVDVPAARYAPAPVMASRPTPKKAVKRAAPKKVVKKVAPKKVA